MKLIIITKPVKEILIINDFILDTKTAQLKQLKLKNFTSTCIKYNYLYELQEFINTLI